MDTFTPTIVGIDPGLGSGFKICVLSTKKDKTFLQTKNLRSLENGVGVVRFISSPDSSAETVKEIFSEINLRKVDVVVGTGTGSAEVQAFLSKCLGNKIIIHEISEDGASIYSTTEAAMAEFKATNPKADIHPSWLGALSIGRRYISPLSELIKIPPQNLGFGQYQHDAKDGTLKVAMERVVTDAVAERGVWVNYDPPSLLSYIPGFTKSITEALLKARPFKSRDDMLKRVRGLGPKTFENACAFCMIDR